MLNILSLLIAVSQRCTSYLNPPNKFKLVDTFFSGNWKTIEPSRDISAGSVISLFKNLVCNGVQLPIVNTGELEKFWAASTEVNDGMKFVKSVITFYYDKSSVKKINFKVKVTLKILYSIPGIVWSADIKFRDFVGIINKYKVNYVQRVVEINCKENLVDAGLSFNYSDKLSTPISFFEFESVEVLPGGSFDYLRGLLCKN